MASVPHVAGAIRQGPLASDATPRARMSETRPRIRRSAAGRVPHCGGSFVKRAGLQGVRTEHLHVVSAFIRGCIGNSVIAHAPAHLGNRNVFMRVEPPCEIREHLTGVANTVLE